MPGLVLGLKRLVLDGVQLSSEFDTLFTVAGSDIFRIQCPRNTEPKTTGQMVGQIEPSARPVLKKPPVPSKCIPYRLSFTDPAMH